MVEETKPQYVSAGLIDTESGLLAPLGGFNFNDPKLVEKFDEHLLRSVPGYPIVQRMIVEMSDWFIMPNSKIYDLGCSTGTTINELYFHHMKNENPKYPRFYGYDFSQEMINAARQKLKLFMNVNLMVKDLNYGVDISDASFVTMLYTLQFVKPAIRPTVIKQIYDGLHDNGALVIVEKVVGNNPKFDEMWIELYGDFKLKNGLSLENVKAKSDSLRGVLTSYSHDKNLQLLEDAGFDDIDVFFKWYNFIGMIAVK